MLLDVNQILGPEGLIARRLKNYEVRQQQLQLAGAIYHSLQHGGHLIAEAGTGIGKSFAYLVPAILHATSDQKEKPTSTTSDDDQDQDAKVRRVVISTHTISLQEQLIHKDLPLLNSVIPREFSSVLVKGRSNYLSRRRYELAGTRAVSLLDEGDQSQLRQIKQWIAQTNDGSLSSLPFRPSPSLWDELASDTSNCMGRKCKTYDSCFYYLARRRIFNAQILVVNHALFFTDLVLRESAGFGLLPPYSAVILDECHTIESVASEHLGIRVTSGQLRYTLNKLFNPMTGKGLFAAMDLHRMCEAVTKAHLMVDQFIFDVDQWLGSSVRETTRVTTQKIVSDSLSDHFLSIAGKLNHLADQSPNAPTYKDISSAAERLTSLATNLRSWLNQSVKELVYWVQRSTSRMGPRIDLQAAPVDISNYMRELLLQQVPSVIMTSATISTGRSGGFEFFQSRVGATGSPTLQLGSPFDYKRQAELIIVTDLPDPSQSAQDFTNSLPEMIQRYLLRTGGHAFVLFTSYGMLRSTASKMQPWFAQHQLTLYSQADGLPRGQLLEKFKANPRGALFGTDSFWQGVDVPGDALGNVIITKLPFSMPDHPLLQARLDAIRQAGGNPFRDYQIPEAVIKLRQGFGRLIRTAQDRGIVVILDPRVVTKSYGRQFLSALPECKISYHNRHGFGASSS